MNRRELKALLALFREYGLSELEIEREGERIRLRRDTLPSGWAPPAALAPGAVPPVPLAGRDAPGSSLLTVEAPMVGTFYRAPSPSGAPYVKEGDALKKGQVVCVIEAMKLMNEIESKVAGRIAKVLVENGQAVEYGQALFLVEPIA